MLILSNISIVFTYFWKNYLYHYVVSIIDMNIRIRPNNRKSNSDSFILCPDGHKNVRGLDDCATCDSPLINFQQELKFIIDMFTNQNLTETKKIINLGIGLYGSQTIFNLSTNIYQSSSNYLVLGSSKLDLESFSDIKNNNVESNNGIFKFDLNISNEINLWSGIGSNLSENKQLDDHIRRVGINENIQDQTVILTGLLGEPLVSAITPYVLRKIQSINQGTSRIIFSVLPSTTDTDQIQFNAYCGLSRIIKSQKASGDILVVLQGNALEKMIGIDRSGKTLNSDVLVPRMLNLISEHGTTINNLSRIAKSLKVLAFSPVYVYGRSYEIYDNIKNILDDAAYFPLSPFEFESIILSIAIIRVPETVLQNISSKRIEDDYNSWNRKRFPALKESLLHIVPVRETSDRMDVLLLLGGAKLANIIKPLQNGYDSFKSYIHDMELWDEFNITEDDLKKLENTFVIYDKNLNKLLRTRS